MDEILESIDNYKKSLLQIEKHRKLWLDTTKQLIYDTLLKIKKSSDLDWQVQKVESLTNLEAVNIHFNKQASGLIETNVGRRANNTKYGGALIFAQAYNGEVFIIYTYPYIDNWVSQLENKLIEKIGPEKITEALIINHVIKFLDEMSKWESSNFKTQIGFTTER